MQTAQIIRYLFLSAMVILVIVAATVLFIILLAQLTEYKPPEQKVVNVNKKAAKQTIHDSVLTLISWNIGYGSLGAEANFFYDGGKMVRPAKALNEQYIDGIKQFLTDIDTIDFILLQEVDEKARRSYFQNQRTTFEELFSNHASVFATNYHVRFVPVPFYEPMGKVSGGLMSFSAFQPVQSLRIGFQKNYKWPTRLFTLKRCFIKQHFLVDGARELVLINTHNSAFDDGELRSHQLHTLINTAMNEYKKGNWVIIGGDWNMTPPGFYPEQIRNGDLPGHNEIGNIHEELLPAGWTWVYDSAVPTNRAVLNAYEKGKTPTTIIDFFLVSPNIELLDVKTHDLGFRLSDHNPVFIKVRLSGLY
jgi:endonuclease/exonuclease/phosphatase family metal-dependent hydrolase